jgi:AbrB family looped-hinge helix DNA binding protein
MPLSVTMSSKNQIVVPSEAREKLHLHAGVQLLVLCKDDRIVLIPKPDDFVERMKGLHRDVWQGTDAMEYLRQERENWA